MASALFDIFFLSGPTPSANDLSPINEEPLRSCALFEENFPKSIYHPSISIYPIDSEVFLKS